MAGQSDGDAAIFSETRTIWAGSFVRLASQVNAEASLSPLCQLPDRNALGRAPVNSNRAKSPVALVVAWTTVDPGDWLRSKRV